VGGINFNKAERVSFGRNKINPIGRRKAIMQGRIKDECRYGDNGLQDRSACAQKSFSKVKLPKSGEKKRQERPAQ